MEEREDTIVDIQVMLVDLEAEVLLMVTVSQALAVGILVVLAIGVVLIDKQVVVVLTLWEPIKIIKPV